MIGVKLVGVGGGRLFGILEVIILLVFFGMR